MKKLVVMRHADAAQAPRDFSRPITSYGIGQAEESSICLKGLISPDQVLVSGALRTRMTADVLADVLELDSEFFIYDNRIYESSLADLTSRLAQVPSEVDELILIGHNPGVSMLVTALCDKYCSFSSGSFALIEFDISFWQDIKKGSLIHNFSPS